MEANKMLPVGGARKEGGNQLQPGRLLCFHSNQQKTASSRLPGGAANLAGASCFVGHPGVEFYGQWKGGLSGVSRLAEFLPSFIISSEDL